MNVSIEIIIAFLSVFSLLIGYIWKDHDRRLGKIEFEIKNSPWLGIYQSIAEIKKDVEWIKKILLEKR
jgi:hypothetical protein